MMRTSNLMGYISQLLSPVLLTIGMMLASCGDGNERADQSPGAHEETAEADYERGPHRGRLLKDKDFAVEITIFETGVPPEFHVFAYEDGKPVSPEKVELLIELTRLDGTVNRFSFKPASDYLEGDGEVVEPHSFDVHVSASYDGKKSAWDYSSYEGRTTINAGMAQQSGIEVEPAGPAILEETLDAIGRVDLAPGAQAILRARFPGQVIAVHKTVGDQVTAGEPLARIESNESLQQYDVTSPMDGVVLERNASIGNVADDEALFVVGDLTRLQVDFHIFPKDLHRVSPGQDVMITSIDDRLTATAKLQTLLPTKELETQTVIARVLLSNPEKTWLPGMTVRGDIVVNREEIPLAVRTEALQRFRDFTVVFARVDETYEVRMLELGRQSPEWIEVLGGIKPGQDYVTQNSFLIKADVEKSGASHDH